MHSRSVSVAPSAARLTGSLRDIGYDFPSAVADLVDNSLAAGASRIEVLITYDGLNSRVLIVDDGSGMSANGAVEALRFGSRRSYVRGELGRYGLGLNTASLSQCRCITVVTRTGPQRTSVRRLDLDTVEHFDDWLITTPGADTAVSEARALLGDGCGTVIVWQQLDRVLQEAKPEGGWARRRLEKLAEKTSEHLALVFHRFLEEGDAGRRVDIIVNGHKLEPWNPFALEEPATQRLSVHRFEVQVGEAQGEVTFTPFVLPPRNAFSTVGEFERLSGPRKWNRQQGLYIYRANRLVQWGGWAGLRGLDEHVKLARAALDFDTDLDEAFNINVAKMRVTIPAQLRQMLDRPVHELCIAADVAYRRAAPTRRRLPDVSGPAAGKADAGQTLLALRAAAMIAGEDEALDRILGTMQQTAPDVAAALGLMPSPVRAVS